jgi:GT2 family glycosyltransferase
LTLNFRPVERAGVYWYCRKAVRVDVVVVTFNSRDRIRACVAPLSAEPGFHVVVVDNASTDGTLGAIVDLPIDVRTEAENRGFGYGCNVGWRAGEAAYVLFLNPDASISPAAVGRLVSTLEGHPRAGAVAPKILESDGSLDFSLRRFPRLASTFSQALFLHRLLPAASWTDELVRDTSVYARPGTAEWVSGACILFRRSVLEQLGGFDDGFFLYSEDKDICCRTWQLGHEVRFDPEAVATHEGGASAPRGALLPVRAASRLRYSRKHRPPVLAMLERVGVALGAATHGLAGQRSLRSGHLRALLVAVGLAAPSYPARTG